MYLSKSDLLWLKLNNPMILLTYIKNLFTAFFTKNHTVTLQSPVVLDKKDPFNDGVDGVPQIRPTDWIRGKESGIVENVRNIWGDWTGYMPPGEWQQDTRTFFDSQACMTFSALNSIEAQLAFMIKMNTISDANIKWLKDNGYIAADGSVNFSDRFTAMMSGTTKKGNTIQNVWGSARNDGLVPESVWPFPMSDFTPNSPDANWEIFYAAIPQPVKDLGLEFKKRFTIQYEWVPNSGNSIPDADLSASIKMAPLNIISAVCMPWSTDKVIPGCGFGTQHATVMAKVEQTFRVIFDSYMPFFKKFASDYSVPFAVRGVILEVVNPVIPARFTHVFTKSFKAGDTDPELELVQNILKIAGYFPLSVVSSGYYGPITSAGVKKLQDAYGIAPDAPDNIGPRTVALLNTLVAAQ